MVCHGNFIGHVSRVFHVSFKEVLICNFVVLQAAQNAFSHKNWKGRVRVLLSKSCSKIHKKYHVLKHFKWVPKIT